MLSFLAVIEIREYVSETGRSPFGRRLSALNSVAAVKITTALGRISQGNLSIAKSLGVGISKYKINFGRSYSIYFGKDSDAFVILLAGVQRENNRRISR